MTTPTVMIKSMITTVTAEMAGMEVAPSVVAPSVVAPSVVGCMLLTVVIASVVNTVKVSQNAICCKMNRHVSASLGLQ